MMNTGIVEKRMRKLQINDVPIEHCVLTRRY